MFRKVVELWSGEQGAVVSSELALIIATVILAADGLVVGLSDLTQGVNSELSRIGAAIGSIPVSYSFSGSSSCTGHFSGSSYSGAAIQPAALWVTCDIHAAYTGSCDALLPTCATGGGGVQVELEVVHD